MPDRHGAASPGVDVAGGVRVVSLIGLGYVGLPTAAMFALSGLTVRGVDVDPMVVDAVNGGRCVIVEPGLPEAVAAAVKSGRFTATDQPVAADAFIIAVPTPVRHDTHLPDVSLVEAAARSMATVLKAGDLVILESTSPIGTTRRVRDIIRASRPDLNVDADLEAAAVDFAYSPERVVPGKTLQEIVTNDRIIGGMGERAARRAAALYKTFVRAPCTLTDDRTAEMVKLAENTSRDVNIALANELSIVCAEHGIDVWEVIRIANSHPRVSILSPGPGVGGHCIPVDPWFLVAASPKTTRLIRTSREVNDAKAAYVIDLVRSTITRTGEPARIACFGLSYKADTDDLRESPALYIVERLAIEYPRQVVAVDPYVEALISRGVRKLAFPVVSVDVALAQCNIVVMLVGHRQFLGLCRPAGCEVVDAIGLWHRPANSSFAA
jgi:UDP-N-acetyl-D-mannosaminuronic acid dehydrogenase